MIAAIILAILMGALMAVVVRGQDMFNALAARTATQMRVQGVLDRMVKELRAGALVNLSTGSPAQFLVVGQPYDNVTFLSVAGVQLGYITWGAPVTYEFVYDDNEGAALGVDDDNDGLIDEGMLFRIQGATRTPLAGRVSHVGFTLSPQNQLVITLTAQAVDEKGYRYEYAGEASVSFRNQ
jgi:hypothetical protein